MQETEFITLMVIMIGCAYSSYRVGLREGIKRSIEFFEGEGLLTLEDEE